MVSFCHTRGVVYKAIKWEEEDYFTTTFHFSSSLTRNLIAFSPSVKNAKLAFELFAS